MTNSWQLGLFGLEEYDRGYVLRFDERRSGLGASEAMVLVFLYNHAGEIFTGTTLAEELAYERALAVSTVLAYVRNLRAAINSLGAGARSASRLYLMRKTHEVGWAVQPGDPEIVVQPLPGSVPYSVWSESKS